MSLDLTPAGASAPRAQRIVSHARTEATLLLRNGEQLLLALVVPVALLVAGRLWGERFGLDPLTFPASVLALAVWSTSFTSLAITTGFERRYGVLERLAATPLTRADLVAGKAAATASITTGQLALLAATAAALGWRPRLDPLASVSALGAVVVAAGVFASLALVLAGRLEATLTLALANLVYVVGAAGGALVVPVAAHPAWAQAALPLLPTAALGESLRAWAGGVALAWPLGVLAGWLVVCSFLARKAFRWTS